MRGIVFTLEASLSLVLALALIGVGYFAQAPSHGTLYAYQAANDVLEVSMRSPANLALVKEFANGNSKPLEEKMSLQFRSLGPFCFKASAKGKEIRQSCFNENRKVRAARPVYDSGYYEFVLEVSR